MCSSSPFTSQTTMSLMFMLQLWWFGFIFCRCATTVSHFGWWPLWFNWFQNIAIRSTVTHNRVSHKQRSLLLTNTAPFSMSGTTMGMKPCRNQKVNTALDVLCNMWIKQYTLISTETLETETNLTLQRVKSKVLESSLKSGPRSSQIIRPVTWHMS